MPDFYLSADGSNGDGLTESTAKTTWTGFMGLTVSGVTTYNIRRGDTFYIDADSASKNNQHGTSSDPVIMRSFGSMDDPPPIVKALQNLNGTWVSSGTAFPTGGQSGGGNTVWGYDLGAETSATQPSGSPTDGQGNLWINNVGLSDNFDDANKPIDFVSWTSNDPKLTFTDPANQGNMWTISTESGGNTSGYIYLCTDSNPNTDSKTYEACVNNGLMDQIIRFFDIDYWTLTGIHFQGGFSNGSIWYSGLTASRNNVGHVIHDCTFSRAYTQGVRIFVSGVNDPTFELEARRNLFTEQIEQGAHGFQLHTSPGCKIIFEKNEFNGCDHGMQIGNADGWAYGRVAYNLFKDTKDDGIWTGLGNPISTTDFLDIYENIFIRCGDQPIQVSGNTGDINKRVRVWNNTIVRANQSGLLVRDCDAACSAKNNIIYNCNRQFSASQQEDDRDYEIEIAGATGPDVDYNLVYSDTTLNLMSIDADATRTATETASWDTYKTNSSQDANGVNADPLLAATTPVNDVDCKLTTGSPAIGAGTTPPFPITKDYFGNWIPAGSEDIGAHQASLPASVTNTGVRVAQASQAGHQNRYLLSASSPPLTAPHAGQRLIVISVHVSWDASVTGIEHKITLDSSFGGSYDTVLKQDSVTGEDWVWAPRYELYLVPGDALDVQVQPSAGRTSYLEIKYRVL